MKERGRRKTFAGEVISDRMNKTRVVLVKRTVKHPKYDKIVTRNKKYAVDDRKNKSHTGDKVEIIETRPLSKTKRWRILRII